MVVVLQKKKVVVVVVYWKLLFIIIIVPFQFDSAKLAKLANTQVPIYWPSNKPHNRNT